MIPGLQKAEVQYVEREGKLMGVARGELLVHFKPGFSEAESVTLVEGIGLVLVSKALVPETDIIMFLFRAKDSRKLMHLRAQVRGLSSVADADVNPVIAEYRTSDLIQVKDSLSASVSSLAGTPPAAHVSVGGASATSSGTSAANSGMPKLSDEQWRNERAAAYRRQNVFANLRRKAFMLRTVEVDWKGRKMRIERGKLEIVFRVDVGPSRRNRLLRKYHLTVEDDQGSLVEVKFPDSVSVEKLVADLSSHNEVEQATPHAVGRVIDAKPPVRPQGIACVWEGRKVSIMDSHLHVRFSSGANVEEALRKLKELGMPEIHHAVVGSSTYYAVDIPAEHRNSSGILGLVRQARTIPQTTIEPDIIYPEDW